MGQLRLGIFADRAQRVGGIVVGADEIERHAILLAEIDELGDPFVVRSRRSADPQPLVHRLQCQRGDTI